MQDDGVLALYRHDGDSITLIANTHSSDKWLGDRLDFIYCSRQAGSQPPARPTLDKSFPYWKAGAQASTDGFSMSLTYEMLHQDADKTVANVLSFLNIPVDAVILQKAVFLSSFETMQAIERHIGIPHYKSPQDDPEAGRMRKGKVEGYTDYLDKEDMDYVHRTCESLLTDASKYMLKQHHVFYIPQGAQYYSPGQIPIEKTLLV